MSINRDKPDLWKNDILQSVDLYLCGYFDSGYLGYEVAEGIDWIWEHRINDLEQLGI